MYEVVDEAKDVRVALKWLTKDEASRRHCRESFEREFNTLSELAHPLIVRVGASRTHPVARGVRRPA